jgi:hypothetical protein
MLKQMVSWAHDVNDLLLLTKTVLVSMYSTMSYVLCREGNNLVLSSL